MSLCMCVRERGRESERARARERERERERDRGRERKKRDRGRDRERENDANDCVDDAGATTPTAVPVAPDVVVAATIVARVALALKPQEKRSTH